MQRPGDVAVSQRDAELGGGGAGGGDAGDDIDGQSRRAERLDLLPRAAEHQRVAAFQADDVQAGAGVLEDEPVDGGLAHGMAAAAFADVDSAGVAPGEVNN